MSRTDDIRNEIHASRARVDESLHGLEERLSPQHLMERAWDYLSRNRDEAAQFGRNLGRTLRDNPVPTVLVGAGLAALAVNSMRHGHGHGHEGFYDPYAERAARPGVREQDVTVSPVTAGTPELGDKSASGVSSARHAAGETYEQGKEAGRHAYAEARHVISRGYSGAKHGLQDAASSTKEMGRHGMESMQHSAEAVRRYGRRSAETVSETYHQQPLIYGALAAVIGLGVAVLLPPSRREDQYLGPRRDELMDKAADAAEQATESAEAVVSAGASAAEEKAKEEGLTPEDMKREADEVMDKAGAVAQAATDAAKDEAARQNPLKNT